MYKAPPIVLVILIILVSSCKSQNNQFPEMQAMLDNAKANFIFVEGGTFIMGDNTVAKASPAHEVTLDSYSIAKYETTFEEYDLYSVAVGKEIVHKKYRNIPRNSSKHGAWHMNWFQAREYCQWLGKQLELPMDLPTEAQWEYAARNRGKNVDHATNNGKMEKDNAGIDDPVGSNPPSPLGIYDMSGSKAEWVLDWFANYRKEPQTNPKGRQRKPSEIEQNQGEKVVRGFPTIVKTTYRRTSLEPENTGYGAGIRCVCNQKTAVN